MSYDSTNSIIEHRQYVAKLLSMVNDMITIRGILHDDSKLEEPEKSIYDEYTPKLKNSTYGSDEYKSFLLGMKVALDHHYEVNFHHPEHFEHGIKDMTLMDIIEMLCDWIAATKRHADGDIMKSIEVNQKRFGYGDELKQIFINTVKELSQNEVIQIESKEG
jgi:hypothetical protein